MQQAPSSSRRLSLNELIFSASLCGCAAGACSVCSICASSDLSGVVCVFIVERVFSRGMSVVASETRWSVSVSVGEAFSV